MIRWVRGVVVEIEEDGQEVQYLTVREEETSAVGGAVHYPRLLGKAYAGDWVWLNTTAVHLALGTGGVHFVAGWVNRAPESDAIRGHMMKLRYTPWQIAVQSGEEQGGPHHEVMRRARSLEGTPVLLCELHSMLPVAAATWHRLSLEQGCNPRIVYVMTDGGSLPVHLSKHVRRLRELGWIEATVSAGHSFGGDQEAVNLYSALLLARHALKADLIVVSMGPGIAGTGTPFGFSGIEQGQGINAVHSLEGIPVVAPRIQGEDPRERHRGISHHTLTILSSVALAPAVVPFPCRLDPDLLESIKIQRERVDRFHYWVPFALSEEKVKDCLREYSASIRTMGRGFRDDPPFFISVSGAARIAWQLMQSVTGGMNAADAIARLPSKDA
ncbi:DUF3866 family protein [Paludifilum halophilum]|uniref:DUF3866 domain-containing protein n=1 Tax=Paludifilum halophilum TaxID=1642702 RepID=A0A235BC62_9BACL|nr:DUF3866 family protein [Paludifilum halophilum]OYD09792.1 hypothetical protein CHM34_02010 [Paludifilum halophilum]